MFINEMSRKSSNLGFSLIELLLVLSLAPVVFFAVYANFSAGIRLWERVNRPVPTEDALIFYQKSRADFENTMRMAEPAFDGTRQEVLFVTAVDAPISLGGDRGIGQVRYYYDESARGIFREMKHYSQMKKESSGVSQRWMPDVSNLAFSYLTYDSTDKKYFWLESFAPKEPGDLPVMVKMEYTLARTGQKIEHIFTIPSGGPAK